MATTRAERALATRRRMVKAAYDQFCAQGYAGATVASIAQAAGVAVPTIYYTFGTKAALLAEALGAAVLGFDRWREPPPDPEIGELLPWHGWWADFQAAPTSDAALEIFLVNGAKTLQRVGALSPTLQGAGSDPEAAEVVRVAEQRRQEAYREALRVLAAMPGGLREGLTLSGAARHPDGPVQLRRLPGAPRRTRLVGGAVHRVPGRIGEGTVAGASH